LPDIAKYDRVAIWLHWLVAAAVVVQFATGWVWGFFERGSEARFLLFRTHIVIGSTILGLACMRLAWRLTHRAPPLPSGMSRATILASKATHTLLYLAILVQPVLGLLAITALGKAIGRWPRELHVALSFVIAGIVALHVAAAFWHHFVRRDGLISRMSPHRQPLSDSRSV
jgi:cytochrome b561